MHTDNQSFAHIQIRCLTRLSETHCFELLTKISRIKLSAGTIWSDSAGFAEFYAPPLAWAHHQAPQGPDRKDMTHLKKTRRGERKQLPPWRRRRRRRRQKQKKLVFYISLTTTASGTVYVQETKTLWHCQLLSLKLPTVAGEELLQQSSSSSPCVDQRACVRGWEMAGSFVCDLMSRGLYDNEC